MDALNRFSADLASWYWWLSVVAVGLAINLASAYIKSPLDAWLEQRSVKRRSAKRKASEAFEAETSEIAADSTLLILEGQASRHAESKYYLHTILTGVNLLVLFMITLQSEPQSSVVKIAGLAVGAFLPLQLISRIASESKTRRFVGTYELTLENAATGWRITHLKFLLKFIDGNLSLESAS